MACDTPVIGKLPNLANGWITEKNGMWVDSSTIIPDLLAQYIQAWLEDSVPTDMLSEMDTTVSEYTTKVQKEKIESVYSTIIANRVDEITKTLDKYEVNNLEEKNN